MTSWTCHLCYPKTYHNIYLYSNFRFGGPPAEEKAGFEDLKKDFDKKYIWFFSWKLNTTYICTCIFCKIWLMSDTKCGLVVLSWRTAFGNPEITWTWLKPILLKNFFSTVKSPTASPSPTPLMAPLGNSIASGSKTPTSSSLEIDLLQTGMKKNLFSNIKIFQCKFCNLFLLLNTGWWQHTAILQSP